MPDISPNFLPPNSSIVWQPQPGPQMALLECPVFEVFYGGARGGGKTESSIGDWLQHSNMYGEYAIGIFVRRKLTQLSEVIARTKQIFTKIGAKYQEQQKTWTMKNGARLRFVYLERDSDAEEYQGHNYTRVYIEEATNFPSPAPINRLRATLRSAVGVPVGMRLTGNPGGPGHLWVKHRYIDPNPKGYQIIQESTDIVVDGERQTVSLERVFIPSKITDNHLLMRNDPTYILRLKQSGSEALVKAWLDGDWDIIEGAYFSEYDPMLHVLPTHKWLPIIPPHTQIFRAMDWGSAKPFCVSWYAVSDGTWGLPNNALLNIHEWYGAKGPNIGLKMDKEMVARGILERDKELFKSYKLRVADGICDPSMFIRDGGPSIAETMIMLGCRFRRGDNRRIPGWEEVRARLVGTNGQPMLYFLDACEDIIRTLPTMQHDETNNEDLDTEGEDHAVDTLRYAATSRPWAKYKQQIHVAKWPRLPGEIPIREMIEMQTKKRLEAERSSSYVN